MLLIWKTVNQNHLGFQKRSSLGSVRVYEGNRVIGSIKELMAVSLQQKSRMVRGRLHTVNELLTVCFCCSRVWCRGSTY
jgi:hypothetical protein